MIFQQFQLIMFYLVLGSGSELLLVSIVPIGHPKHTMVWPRKSGAWPAQMIYNTFVDFNNTKWDFAMKIMKLWDLGHRDGNRGLNFTSWSAKQANKHVELSRNMWMIQQRKTTWGIWVCPKRGGVRSRLPLKITMAHGISQPGAPLAQWSLTTDGFITPAMIWGVSINGDTQ